MYEPELPPDAVAVITALLPKQIVALGLVVTVILLGSVIVTTTVDEFRHSLVTMQEYVPADKPDETDDVTLVGSQLYVKEEPPAAVTVAEPEEPPLHKLSVLDAERVSVGQIEFILAILALASPE